MKLPFPPALVITDRHQAPKPLPQIAAQLFAGGCRWLSLREKDLGPAERISLLRQLIALGQPSWACVMVHDDVAGAAEVGAAGVHLPANGNVAKARRLLGSSALIGQSAHTTDEVARAAADGADYVTLSPIFATSSKPGYGPALGHAALNGAWRVPVVALGGIDASNAHECLVAGATGVAVMGGAMRAPDPQAFMADLLQAMGVGVALAERGSHS